MTKSTSKPTKRRETVEAYEVCVDSHTFASLFYEDELADMLRVIEARREALGRDTDQRRLCQMVKEAYNALLATNSRDTVGETRLKLR